MSALCNSPKTEQSPTEAGRFAPAGLRGRTRIAHDADDHARNLSRWEQRYNQFSRGRFEGRVTELWLPDLQIFLESANQALHQSCAAWPDAVWVGIPCALSGPLRMDARPMRDNTLLLCPGGEQFELQTPENTSLLGIVVGRQMLGSQLSQIEAIDAGVLDRQGALQVPSAHYQALSATLLRLLSASSAQSGAAPGPADIYETTLTELGAAISAGTPLHQDRHAWRIQHSRRLVNEVCEHVLAQTDQRLSIADICRYLHISRRSLQYAFQDATGLAPLAYLRTLRLNQVRRGLREAPAAAHPVTATATRWGFEHLGQFSQDYRKLFGESPSATVYERGASQG